MTNLANGQVAAGSRDAVNGGQLYTIQQTANGALQTTGGTMSGNINMGGNRITNVGAPTSGMDAVNRDYVDGIQAQNTAQFDMLTTGLNSAFNNIERNGQGVALAMAMGGGFLSDDKDMSLWGAWGHFDGYDAFAAQTYIRLTDDMYLNGAISYGVDEHLVGTRVGFGIQF